jgi:D-sedoheptulose 7-phosphate isomerase
MTHDEALALVARELQTSARILNEIAQSQCAFVVEAARLVETSLKAGGTLYTCGNGGSAADAQHIAAELSGRFYIDRPGLAATALTVNTSALTAIANDFTFVDVFARQLEGVGRRGDVLLGMTTSGGSSNVVAAVTMARRVGMRVIGMTGARGANFARSCDLALVVPSEDVARIQEAHIASGHLICQLVEDALFGGQD